MRNISRGLTGVLWCTLILSLFLLQGCSSKSVISLPSSDFTTITLEKPLILDNGKMQATIPEIKNTGERFGLNGSLSDEEKGKYYFIRLKLLVKNISTKPVEFNETTIAANANNQDLAHSGLGSAVGNSDDSIMTFNGGVATIKSNETKTLYMFYRVPNNANKVELTMK